MNDLNSAPESLDQQAPKNPEIIVEAVASPPLPAVTGDWRVIVVKPRVDSFNQELLVQEIKGLREAGHQKIALDMRANRFFSLRVIQFCVDLSHEMTSETGNLVLIGCPQKTKRHFEIYGSLKHIRLVRSERELTAI